MFLTLPASARAAASTLPPLPAHCFTYSAGKENGGAHRFSATAFRAELTGTPLSIVVKSLTLHDHKAKLSPAALGRLNAAAAYNLLTAYHHGFSANCTGLPLPGIEEVKGALPEAEWSDITLVNGVHRTSLRALHLRILSTVPDIHVRFEGDGYHDPLQPLMPEKISADFTLQASSQPPYRVTFNAAQAMIGPSAVNGHGRLSAGKDMKSSTADLHFSVTNIGPLTEKIGQKATTKVMGALLIARMMGHRDGDATSWDVQLKDGTLSVNQVPIPIAIR